jgi:hypothetical protein
MAGLTLTVYGQSHPLGMRSDGQMPVILSSPQHHIALLQYGAYDRWLQGQLAGLNADAGGLKLSIVRVRRPT